MTSVVYGMRGDKGRINCSFGDRITSDCLNIKEASEMIDKQIYLNYKLWPTNYIAHDMITETETYSEKYTEAEKYYFLLRYEKLKKEVRRIVLQTYANPVFNYTSTIHPSGATTSPS